MIELRTVDEVRARDRSWRRDRHRVGVVMTMGALHAGHLSLVERARADCDRVLATVFVNPLQFGPAEDYDAYPRDEARDLRLLAETGCDAVFLPTVETMFPDGERDPAEARTVVNVRGITEILCGRHRPGHFVGMCTEVLKMFNLVGGDAAYFGEKDFQQLAVVRAMVRDLGLPVEVVGCPTVREPDGTAMSSRNAYLTTSARATAPELYRVLRRTAAELVCRPADAGRLAREARAALLDRGFDAVEYVEIRDDRLREPADAGDPRALRVFAAVRLGSARLIDNVAVGMVAANEEV